MLYDDEPSKALDDKMEEMVQQARDFVENEAPALLAHIKKIIPAVQLLASEPNRTPEQDAALQELAKTVKQQLQAINDMKAVMEADITARSIALYEHYKKLAEEGNEKAKEIYEDLRPYYLAMLQEKMDSNLQ